MGALILILQAIPVTPAEHSHLLIKDPAPLLESSIPADGAEACRAPGQGCGTGQLKLAFSSESHPWFVGQRQWKWPWLWLCVGSV